MENLKGQVAAVTGAGSGLGRAMALAFADEGMDLGLADVSDLSEVRRAVEAKGVKASTMKVDVSKAEEVQKFCDSLQAVHVVCNNAGIAVPGAAWENSIDDWRWILGVNLWGVIHGVRSFAPRLIAQDEGHIVNTASVAGLISPPASAAYNVTKHAVVTLSESLYHDLRERSSRVGVSVLCPAYVPTGIADSERNRPADSVPGQFSEKTKEKQANMRKAVASGRLSAQDVARAVVAAVREERFYILTHAKIKGAIRARMEDILEDRPPRNPLGPL
jgi:NAD(P)-dependent dehydrogenase (short-subunit alcohol dehydrogenase family)